MTALREAALKLGTSPVPVPDAVKALKGAIAVDSHDDWHNRPGDVFRLGVEFLNELAQVDAVRPQRRTNRRSWRRLPTGDLNFDLCYDRFGHVELSIWVIRLRYLIKAFQPASIPFPQVSNVRRSRSRL